MSTACPLEKSIPPEASEDLPDFPHSQDHEEAFRRFSTQIDSGLLWNPDDCPEPRLDPDEAIQLENRGITSPNREKLPQGLHSQGQAEFWRKQTAHKFTVAAKLREAGMTVEATKLEDCHSRYTIAVCSSCSAVKKFPNRCDLFFCPECQTGLARDRKRQVEWWTATISQPKHVVLTLKNLPDLTRAHLNEISVWFTNLRRRSFAKNWKGGFYSIECTNEGKGWHIHIHALIDAKWIDSAQLALQWDSVTHGFGRIVKVKDCRKHDYLAEVTKYAVKGVQLAAWQPEDIACFVRAFTGKRTFGVFGDLYGARTEFAEFIATMKAARPRCECGCSDALYYSEAEWILKELQSGQPALPRAPTSTSPETPALFREFRWPD